MVLELQPLEKGNFDLSHHVNSFQNLEENHLPKMNREEKLIGVGIQNSNLVSICTIIFSASVLNIVRKNQFFFHFHSLQAGKAVFTEKPVAEETKAVERVYQLAEKVKRPMFCAFNRRFDPSFDAIYRQVRAGQLGQVHQIKLTSRDSPLPSEAYLKISGGIFHDCMVHDIDLMTYVLGEYPIEVYTVSFNMYRVTQIKM